MTSDGSALPTSFTEFVGRHLTWVLSLLPFVLVGIKLLFNSGGNVEVFRFLIQNVNIIVLLMAAIVPLIPVAVFWMYVIAIEWWIITPKGQRQINIPDWIFVPMFGGLFILVLLMPAMQLILNVGLVALLLAIRKFFRWLNRNEEVDALRDEPMREEFIQTFMFGVVAALIYAPSMWLPAEEVKLKNGETQGGYVLSSADQWTTFLSTERRVQILRSSDIESRRPCVQGGDTWFRNPIWDIGSDKYRYPACPPKSLPAPVPQPLPVEGRLIGPAAVVPAKR